jgi:hypothetical protein
VRALLADAVKAASEEESVKQNIYVLENGWPGGT